MLRRCIARAPAAAAGIALRSANSTTASVGEAKRSETRCHRKLYNLTVREEREERLRDFLPVKPLLPTGWRLTHTKGSSRFDLFKEIEIRECGVEEMHVVALMERKQYEGTYRMDNGERAEQEYLNFTLFMRKRRFPQGGLEFSLTTIDMELVMDSLAIHPTDTDFENAKMCFDATQKGERTTNLASRGKRDALYRGPMLSELDDDLSDEILDYLDERGINNAFAEFMMSQAYYLEQEEYINWLRLLRKFSD